MRKELIVKHNNNKFSIYGYEILADFPQLIINEDIDFRTFKLNLDLLKEESIIIIKGADIPAL